ncbi:MAG: hypothetical protein FJX77_03170 [Armatimonadetes bacterium]|nr:hypothetical protein [Armatimonadota bacterium]
MAPPPNVRRAQYEALLSAYPSRDEFARLVRLHLGLRLDDIVKPADQRTTVLELLQWAESRGRLNELLEAAAQEIVIRCLRVCPSVSFGDG